MFTYGDSGKLPFEDRVVQYLRAHPNEPRLTVTDCAQSIGISEAAVYAVLANLEAKGVVEYTDEKGST